VFFDKFIQYLVAVYWTRPSKGQNDLFLHPEAHEDQFQHRAKLGDPGVWKIWNDFLDNGISLVISCEAARQQLFYVSTAQAKEGARAEVVKRSQRISLPSATGTLMSAPKTVPYVDHCHVKSWANHLFLYEPNRSGMGWINHDASKASC
jgi:hypothetical protein